MNSSVVTTLWFADVSLDMKIIIIIIIIITAVAVVVVVVMIKGRHGKVK